MTTAPPEVDTAHDQLEVLAKEQVISQADQPETIMLAWGRREVVVMVVRSIRKSLVIEVLPTGEVVAKAPIRLLNNDIEEALTHRLPWIIKQLDYFDTFNPRTRPLKFVSGGSVKYLGRHYRFKVRLISATASPFVNVEPGYIYLNSQSESPAVLAALFQQFQLERAEALFNALLKEVFPLFNNYDLPEVKLKLRTMPKRWGSCTRRGLISLHPDLLKAPRACIKYVIVHELCHLVVWNHNKAFYALQRQLLPEAETLKQRLELWMG